MRGYPYSCEEEDEKDIIEGMITGKVAIDGEVTDKEQEKRHLYAKLLSVISDEDRLKYEKALASLLTKKRGS